MLRAQTTITRTAGIPTRPGSTYQQLVPWHKIRVIIGQSRIHYSSNGKTAAVELTSGGKIHIAFLFFRLKVHNMCC